MLRGYPQSRSTWGFIRRGDAGRNATDDSKVAAYKMQRRQRSEGPWTDADMAMDTEATLHSQARGKEWEYRVTAVNKAGEGEPSWPCCKVVI